jgi:AraC-like DNA-binding protein
VDPLDAFLDGPRAARAFVMMAEMAAPWAIEVRDEAALTVVVQCTGGARVDATELRPGDVALVRGPLPYVVTDDRGSDVTVVIEPGQVCVSRDGRPLHEEWARGLRHWGNSSEPDATMLIAAYASDAAVGRLIAPGLPPVLVVRDDEHEEEVAAVARLLVAEADRSGPGQQVVLDRLLDVLTVAALRAWLRRHPLEAPRSWMGGTDAVVTEALRLLHARPAEPWSVASLAAAVHVSRATLAARFASATATTPMAHLTEWRLDLAADELAAGTAGVAEIGARVGYGNPFAFSAAFKRRHGMSPSQYRATAIRRARREGSA